MKAIKFIIVMIIILCCATVVLAKSKIPSNKKGGKTMEIKITGSAFKEGEFIPVKYTCDGEDISPPLAWSNVPEETKSLAIISDDPDAPMGTWVHWVIFNIPPKTTELSENVPKQKVLSNGAKQGINSGGQIGYEGPCPPGGTHRYFFKIYALDTELKLDAGVTKEIVLKAMEKHILAQGQLMGKYARK